MDKILIKKLAKNIKKYRKLNKMTQDDLAFLAELPRSTIGNIETVSNDIVLSKINKIAKAFHIKLSELLDF
jgi:transcriptional regulator with XRE-family HTH domain